MNLQRGRFKTTITRCDDNPGYFDVRVVFVFNLLGWGEVEALVLEQARVPLDPGGTLTATTDYAFAEVRVDAG